MNVWVTDQKGRVELVDNIPHRLRHLWQADPMRVASMDVSLWGRFEGRQWMRYESPTTRQKSQQ